MPLHRDRSAINITLPRTKPRASPSAIEPAGGSPCGLLQPDTDQLGTRRHRPPLSDRRLPLPGTRLVRTAGGRTCECVVEREGVRYAGRLYRSLSGAAAAAARDQGLSPSQNGFAFWLRPPSRTSALEVLERTWERYHAALRRLLSEPGVESTQKVARHVEIARAELLALRNRSSSA